MRRGPGQASRSGKPGGALAWQSPSTTSSGAQSGAAAAADSAPPFRLSFRGHEAGRGRRARLTRLPDTARLPRKRRRSPRARSPRSPVPASARTPGLRGPAAATRPLGSPIPGRGSPAQAGAASRLRSSRAPRARNRATHAHDCPVGPPLPRAPLLACAAAPAQPEAPRCSALRSGPAIKPAKR